MVYKCEKCGMEFTADGPMTIGYAMASLSEHKMSNCEWPDKELMNAQEKR